MTITAAVRIATALTLLSLLVPPVFAQEGSSSSGSTAPTDQEAEPQSSVQDVYREQHALFGENLTIEPSITWTHSDRNDLNLSGLNFADAIFLGRISVDRVKRDTIRPELSFRYNWSDRLQSELTVPWVYRRSQFVSTAGEGEPVEATVNDSGIGDTNLRMYYRWLNETTEQPDVVFNFGVTAPTGSDPFGIPTETRESSDGANRVQFPTKLPTGNGVWGVSLGTSVLKTLDPAVLFASVGLDIAIPEEFDDIAGDTAGDQPGRVDLGDTLSVGFGTAFALNRDLSLSMSLSNQFTTKSRQKPEGQSYNDVVGSDSTVSVLNLGATLNLGPKSSMSSSVGIGLTEDAPDFTLRLAMPFNF